MRKISVNAVSKQFGETKALDNVTVSFESEKIYGLLGRNGAGKSTLLNIISNREFPTGGNVSIDGEPAMENDAVQGRLYLMSEKNLYPKEFKVKDVFRWTGEFYGEAFDNELAMELAEQYELDVKKRISGLSTGYKSIYKNIVALSLNVPYLFLDEPVLGLDANFRDLFYRQLMEGYIKKPRTIVISTHLIEEISSIIEHVVMINYGRIIMDKSAEEMLAAAYSVSGAAADVDAYTRSKNKIGEENIGNMKQASIYGDSKPEFSDKLKIDAMDLQKLFVTLTNRQEGKL